jgi:hypothetical protein
MMIRAEQNRSKSSNCNGAGAKGSGQVVAFLRQLATDTMGAGGETMLRIVASINAN